MRRAAATPPCGQPVAEAAVGENLPDGADHRCAVVGHDERLAVLEEPGDAAAVRDDDRRPRCGRFRGDHAEALARRGEHEDVRLRVEVARRLLAHRQGVDPAARRVVRLRSPQRLADTVTVVGPRDDDVRLRQLARGREQVLDPFACRDPADVEDRAARRRGCSSCARRPPFELAAVRLGEAVAANVHLRGIHAARDDVVALALGGDDDRSSAARDTSVERCVERTLEQDLAEPRLEHPERLEDVRDASDPAPRGGARRDRVAEAEHVHGVRAVRPRERERKRRRDPHPAVAQRRREVVDRGPVDDVDGRPCRRSPVEVDDRGRQHVHGVPASHEPPDELSRRHDRAAEGAGGSPDRRREENA